jgi:hypothetical protein
MKDFIEFVEEVGNAVSLQETAAQKEWEIWNKDISYPASWTDGRPRPKIANQLAGGK